MSTRRNIWSRCGHFQAEDATHCDNPDCRAVEVETDDTPRLGHVVDGKVTILGVLGKGGMGTVYRAFQHSVAREVALKVLNQRADDADGKQARSFLKEAGSASRLSHPNIISVYDVGQSPDGELYLIMERLDGNPLSTVLKQDGPLAPERAVAIAIQVCDALHEAHEQGVIHRDLKPSNIFIRPGAGRYGEFAKVLDFGIAKLQKVDGAESISHTGIVSGTPSYMCPEQILGKAVDRRVDVYALGVIVYMMLTGERPVPKGTQVETLLAHLNDPPAPIATRNPEVAVPPALAELVMACLEKEPDDRPASTLAVKRRLQAVTLSKPMRPPSTAKRRCRQHTAYSRCWTPSWWPTLQRNQQTGPRLFLG
jgi:serine/threonine protein kinase